MTAERRPLAMPHVDDGAPRFSSGAQAGLALIIVAVLAPVTAFLGVVALVAAGGVGTPQVGMAIVLAVLTLGAAVATIVTLGWGAGRLSVPGMLAYLTLAALLIVLMPWLMLTGVGDA